MSITPPKNDKARKEWLASLKDGDEVAVLAKDGFRQTTIRRGEFQRLMDGAQIGYTLATGKVPGEQMWLVPLTAAVKDQLAMQAKVQTARKRMREVWFYGSRWMGHVSSTDAQVLACAAIMWPEEFGGKS